VLCTLTPDDVSDRALWDRPQALSPALVGALHALRAALADAGGDAAHD
jgi:hypothetical protein